MQNQLLGKLPAKNSLKALLFANYIESFTPPPVFNFWKGKKPFALRTFGNTEVGDCTRASQALLSMRMERMEVGRTPIITDKEIVGVYYDMTKRLYGGGDTGAYEEDALSEWRKPDLTFRDTKGRPITIDAFTKINVLDITEIKKAIAVSGAHGIKLCFNLPNIFKDELVWDAPADHNFTGDALPGSWGGHSTVATAYDEFGVIEPTSWGLPDLRISWAAVAAYADEAHSVIDSLDTWSKRKRDRYINLAAIKSDVNAVSSQKIK